jgi:hypothetical protein
VQKFQPLKPQENALLALGDFKENLERMFDTLQFVFLAHGVVVVTVIPLVSGKVLPEAPVVV